MVSTMINLNTTQQTPETSSIFFDKTVYFSVLLTECVFHTTYDGIFFIGPAIERRKKQPKF